MKPEPNGDIVWGAKAIGVLLNLTERQAYHRLESGQIPCAKKFGATWAVSRMAVRQMFETVNDTSKNGDGHARNIRPD